MQNIATTKEFRYFSKRNFVGALLFLLFVGEGTVGFANGLFTLPGFLVLGGLYLALFWFYESLIAHYNLTYKQLIPLTFAIYAVLITGLLHGELANYAKDEAVITTLIRIQCSLFPIFAYYLLGKFSKRPSGVPSVKKTGLILLGFFLLLTPTKQFGFINLFETIQKVPLISAGFILAAVLCIIWALKPVVQTTTFASKTFSRITWGILAISCIPHLAAFLVLLVVMPIVTLVYLRNENFKRAKA